LHVQLAGLDGVDQHLGRAPFRPQPTRVDSS
jgi:hypothetical protein